MIDFRTLSDTSTSKIPILSYPLPLPQAQKRYHFRTEPPRIGQYREYPPPREFAIFPAIRKLKFPQIKIYSRALKYSLDITDVISYTNKTVLRNRVCSTTTCLFHSETKRYTMKHWCICLKIHVCISIVGTQ